MNAQTITVRLPENLYQQVKNRSQRTRRTVEEEIVTVIASALPLTGDLPDEVERHLSALEHLSDEELWQAARMQVPERYWEEMQTLLDKQQREGLTAPEKARAEELARYADRVMLVRAKAAALLKERGYRIDSLNM